MGMVYDEKTLDGASESAQQLVSLLSDRRLGLSSWWTALYEAINEIAELRTGDKVIIDGKTFVVPHVPHGISLC